MQYYIVKHNIPKMSLVRETGKPIVEAISNQLEYVTKAHIAIQTILL